MKFNQKQYQTNLKVGIFVILGIVIMVLGYLWFSNYLEKGSMTRLMAAFPDASGLEPGDGVLIMGVNRGKVTSIELTGDMVHISMSVKLDQPLREGSRFIIRNTSLMGSTRIIIQPGTGKNLLDTSQLQIGSTEPGFTALSAQAGKLLEQSQLFLGSFTMPDNVFAKFSSAADSLQATLAQINDVLQENQSGITESVNNLSFASGQIAELLITNKADLDSTLAGSNDLVASLIAASDSLQALSSQFSMVAQKLQNKDSTLHELTSDDQLYQNLLRSTAQLDSLLTDIKKNPKRYFTVEIF